MAAQGLVSFGSWLLPLFILVIIQFNIQAGAKGVGVNYGMLGDNLPSPKDVVALYKSRNIQNMRIYEPKSNVLNALHGSSINVILGTLNEDLMGLANNQSFANAWVNTNVIPFIRGVNFSYVSAGNEVIPGNLSSYVLPAIKNIQTALKAANIAIPVTTAISMGALGLSYPPSAGSFSGATFLDMMAITDYLASNKVPLLVNVYPYFAYASNTKDIRLDYALFTATQVIVQDGILGYKNLFDAMVDAVYSALEKVGGPQVQVIVSETGWPSAGNGNIATIANAKVYNNNLVAHVASGKGTPKRPNTPIEAYLFAMFNENLKTPPGIEQNFGLYYPSRTEVYHVNFTP